MSPSIVIVPISKILPESKFLNAVGCIIVDVVKVKVFKDTEPPPIHTAPSSISITLGGITRDVNINILQIEYDPRYCIVSGIVKLGIFCTFEKTPELNVFAVITPFP